MDPNYYDWWLVIATFVSALITLGMVGVLWRQTDYLKHQTTAIIDQTKSIQKQEQRRIRPWIKIGNLHVSTLFYADGSTVSGKNEKITIQKRHGDVLVASLSVFIENIGLDVAERVFVKYYDSGEPFTKEMLWKKETKHAVFPLLPGENWPYNKGLEGKRFYELNDRPHYIGIHVAYEVNGKFETIGKIWEVGHISIGINEYWINEEPNE